MNYTVHSGQCPRWSLQKPSNTERPLRGCRVYMRGKWIFDVDVGCVTLKTPETSLCLGLTACRDSCGLLKRGDLDYSTNLCVLSFVLAFLVLGCVDSRRQCPQCPVKVMLEVSLPQQQSALWPYRLELPRLL